MSEPLYCINHPDRETLLRCGKCGQPICPQCAVRHPVGLRCPQCAQLKKVPTYDVSAQYYLRALGAGLGASILCSLAVEVARLFLPIFFLSFIQAISKVTAYKRGRGLQIVAGLTVILGTIAGTLLIAVFRFGPAALLLVPGFVLNPYYWLYPIVAAAVAVTRLR